MDFYRTRFDIKPENKMIVFRINDSNNSPRKTTWKDGVENIPNWDYSAGSLSESNGVGVYAVYGLSLALGYDLFFRMYLSTIKQDADLKILLLEVDKNDIIFQNEFEISFSRANIKNVFSKESFIRFCKQVPGFVNVEKCFLDSEHPLSLFQQGLYKEWLLEMKLSMAKMFDNIRANGFSPKIEVDNLEALYMDNLHKKCSSYIADYENTKKNI